MERTLIPPPTAQKTFFPHQLQPSSERYTRGVKEVESWNPDCFDAACFKVGIAASVSQVSIHMLLAVSLHAKSRLGKIEIHHIRADWHLSLAHESDALLPYSLPKVMLAY